MESPWCFLIAATISFYLSPSYGSQNMDIHSMQIQSTISSRFARTVITTMVKNLRNASGEAIFDVELPKTAFITRFSMTVDNITTLGSVKQKDEAKKLYRKAVSKGQSAGLIQSTGRKMEHFKISVNVGSLATATFTLTYEELLKRQLGNYEFYLKVRPKELVEHFQINVDIVEPQGISFLKAVGTFMSNALADVVKVNLTENKAHIQFKPTLDQQRNCPNCIESLLDGDLVIKYDVKRDNSAGKIQVINGYFVHYFAPATLQRMPKNVVFVIDRSGSMSGNKIKQTYEAFIKILEDVPNEDNFGIVLFDDKLDIWRKSLTKATTNNIKNAKEFVLSLNARGGTDINKALVRAAALLKVTSNTDIDGKVRTSIIIFLSDGDPTSGITDHNTIIKNVKHALGGKATLYCLGFGNDLDYNFLEKLALENGGLARRIYEDSDSALQLQGFYNEVAFPMLSDINLQYLDNSVDDLTQNTFRHYYQGSEIVVAGHITGAAMETLTAQVTAQGVSEPFSVKVEAPVQEENHVTREQRYIFEDFTERLWAYLTIEQLLSKQISTEGKEKQQITEKALNLSLKYSFVTPLTSMVVLSPEKENENKPLVANKPHENDQMDIEYGEPLLHTQNVADDDIDVADDGIDEVAYDTEYSDFFLGVPTFATVTTTPTPSTCPPFHVLLSDYRVSQRICYHVSEAPSVFVNLFHDAGTGITINGQFDAGHSFQRLGLMNSKMSLRVDVTADNIGVTQDEDVQTYRWNSTFQQAGFLKKDEERILVTLEEGATMTILRFGGSLYLSSSLDNKYLSSNKTSGIIGQLLNYNKTSFQSNVLVAGGQRLPLSSFSNCDFAPYEITDGSCLYLTRGTNEIVGGVSNVVPSLLHVPL